MPSLRVILIAVVIHVSAAATTVCPANEEWNECDSACPLTCQNQTIAVCVDSCVPRCSCVKGFIRESPGGRCVPESCDFVCGDNEKFSTCASLCPRSCNQEPRICPLVCVRGCVCEDGYIRSTTDGKCIPTAQCIPKCGKNEEFTNCGTACPPICNTTLPNYCSLQCISGCFCKDGFIRESKGGACVSERVCTPKCGENEEYKTCGSACSGRCRNPLRKCDKRCVKGCFCKKGFLLNDELKCISEDSC